MNRQELKARAKEQIQGKIGILFLITLIVGAVAFVAGILASNHDVTDLFIDATLRICANDVSAFEKMVEEIDVLTVKKDVNIVMTASIDEAEASDVVKKYI